MQTELKIKDILKIVGSAESKAKSVCKLMNWDEKELISVINKYGTSSKEGRASIIKHFWGQCSIVFIY